MTYDREHFIGLSCPTDVTWTKDIKEMFTSDDIDHMETIHNINLGSYDSVKKWANAIYSKVKSGAMPPPGFGEERWSTEKVTLFGCWIQQGTPEG